MTMHSQTTSVARGGPADQGESGRLARNAAHWRATLDAHNLGREERPVPLGRVAELFQTADVRQALRWMAPLRGARVLDLGGGLGAMALLLARRGALVTIADISPPRLAAARRALAAHPREAARVSLVAAAAESLPFPDGAFDRVFTKSVLIHTDLPRAAAECARVLAAGGRAAFIEPQRRNPLVNAYRRLAAPREWAAITTYFGPAEWRVVATALRARHPSARVRLEPFHFLGFLATAFQFALPSPPLARAAEAALLALDRPLLRRGSPARPMAWFGALLADAHHAPAPSLHPLHGLPLAPPSSPQFPASHPKAPETPA